MDIAMQMIALPVVAADSQGICLQTTAPESPASAGFAASLEQLLGQSVDERSTDEKGLAVLSGLLNLLTGFSTIPGPTDAVHEDDAGVLLGKEAVNDLFPPVLIAGQQAISSSDVSAVQEFVQAEPQKHMQMPLSMDGKIPFAEAKNPVMHQQHNIVSDEAGKSSLPLSGTENVTTTMQQKRPHAASAHHPADAGASQYALKGLSDKQDSVPVNSPHTGFSGTLDGEDLSWSGKDESPSKSLEPVKLSLERATSPQSSFNETLIQEDGAMTGGQGNRGLTKNIEQFELREVRPEQKIPEALHVSKAELSRGDVTSLKVSLAPEGIGELDIELVLNKGMVNGHILAAEGTGKAAIERNLQHMVDALMKDGINLGGVSVSLRERRDETFVQSDGEYDRHAPELRHAHHSADSAGSGLINIYV